MTKAGPTDKSEAEKQRAEWLTRQYAAEQASIVQPSYPQLTEDGLERRKKRAVALAAAREAVVTAALAWYRDSLEKDPRLFLAACERLNELDAACEALDKLETTEIERTTK